MYIIRLCRFDFIENFQSFIFCFGHEPVRDQFKSTVLWRAHCHRVLEHFQSKRTQDFRGFQEEFEALFKDFTRAHQKYKINKSSAYQQISDSVTRLLNEQRIVVQNHFNSNAVGFDSWVQTVLKSILWGTQFLDQLHMSFLLS